MNKMMITILVIIIVAVVVGALAMSNKKSSSMPEQMVSSSPSASMAQGVMVGGAAMTPNKNIVENAVNSKDHTTLVAAVKAAGLVNALEGKGPFTVFAPTNEAFNNLPAGTVQSLLQPENKAKLTSVLEYHVVPGAYKISDLQDGQKLKTLEGGTLQVTKKGSDTFINGVAITIPDVIDSNGVTHVIGSVLMPQ